MVETITNLIPKKYMIFLDSKEGLSSSEATHYAEKIKEIVKNINDDIENMGVVTETVIFKGSKVYLSNPNSIKTIEEYVKKIGELHSLAGWLREGVKSKNQALITIDSIEDCEILPEPKLEKLEYMESYSPNAVYAFTENDAISKFSFKERSEYISLTAKAAAIGKVIHGDGLLSILKKECSTFKEIGITSFLINGVREEFPTERKINITRDELNKIFFSLQKTHREIENKLNWFKSKIKNTITRETGIRLSEHKLKEDVRKKEHEAHMDNLQKIKNKNLKIVEEYTNKILILRNNTRGVVSSYKIVIPNELTKIFGTIKNY